MGDLELTYSPYVNSKYAQFYKNMDIYQIISTLTTAQK